MNSKFKIQSRFNRDQSLKFQFKIQNLIIWKLIENCLSSEALAKKGKLKIGNSSQGGYIAISMVLILSAVILGIIVTVARLGIGEGQVSLALSKGEESLAFVEGCAEDALLKSRADANFNGGSIMLPEGFCDIAISKISTPWIMTATTSNITYKRTIEIKYTRNPTGITLSSWKEI